MEFSQPVLYHNCSSKDLVGADSYSYDLSLATFIARIGVSFSRLRHDPREVTRPVADALVCSISSMRKHPEIFGADVSVNHSRPER